MKYIIPQFTKYQDIDELLENNSRLSLFDEKNNLSIDKLLEENFVCIVGEPGIGKSRLLDEVKERISAESFFCKASEFTDLSMESLDKLFNENLDKLKKPFRQIRNSLRKLREHVFHFLKDPRVRSHNNASESGIRILKVKQKRSGGFRSQTGAEDFMAIHSVSDTAKKNNFSRWEAVLALV